MGFAQAFSYRSAADIFAEHAGLSACQNEGTRAFDIGAYAGIAAKEYDRLAPFQWPQPAEEPARVTRHFAEGGFFTADGKGRFVPTPWRAPAQALAAAFPLTLNTGRIRDQWHTMTRTAKTARLMSHVTEPFVEVHPADAQRYGLADGGLAIIRSSHAEVVVRVAISPGQKPGSVFVPIHWTDQYASCARVDALIEGAIDPVSGQPELKFTPVSAAPYPAAWHAFAVAERQPDKEGLDYWALARTKGGFRYELAGRSVPDDWTAFAHAVLSLGDGADVLAYHDAGAGQYRFAAFDNGRLTGALFIARGPVSQSRSWACEQLGRTVLEPRDRLRLLAGRAAEAGSDAGSIVCSCFEVGEKQIAGAVASGGCTDVEEIGKALRAGTNCGSCRPEIKKIIQRHRSEPALAGGAAR